MSLIQELQRRNVIRVGLAYAAASWLLIQLAEIVFEAWAVPEVGLRILITVLAIGLPLVLLFAWAFELTPEGLKRESEVDRTASVSGQTGRRLDRVIIVVLALALGYFALDKFVLRSPEDGAGSSGTTASTASNDASPGADSPPTLPTDASVAVMPLRNVGQAGEGDGFALGMHDGLLTALAQVDALRVVSRSSVLRIAEEGLSTAEVAEVLQVATVLEGGIQRAGDQLRVSLQLVDPVTESYLWAETFDRQLTTGNIFDIQNEIARAVTVALEESLTASDEQRLSRLPTEDLEALESYFIGRALIDQRTEAAITEARDAFRQAHERDPDFAQALAGEAQAILLLRQGASTYGSIPGAEAVALAAPLLERAGTLAPDDAEVLAVQGLLLYDMGQLEASLELLRRSLDINPANGSAYAWLYNSLQGVGDLAAATALVRVMLERDPTSRVVLSNAADILTRQQVAGPGEVDAIQERLMRLDRAWGLRSRSSTQRIEGDVLGSIRDALLALEVDDGMTQVRDNLAAQLIPFGLIEEARLMAATLPESAIATAIGDAPRALALAQAEFEANPSDQDTVIRLAYALALAQQWDEALRLAQVIWEATGRVPTAWPPGTLVEVAWMARHRERTQVYETFVQAAGEAIEARRAENIRSDIFEMGRARYAALQGDPEETAQYLGRAIDLGYRDLRDLDLPIWDEVRDSLGFVQQQERLAELIESERAQIIGMLCGPEAIMTWREPAPATCAEA